MTTTTDIEQLDAFLRSELAAVDAYARVLERLHLSIHRLALASCKGSHALRATLLRRAIAELGGTPSDEGAVWMGFANHVENVSVLGEQAAIAALEEGEDRGHKYYWRGLPYLTPQVRPFVSRQLLPEQQRTHAMLVKLRRQMLRRARLVSPLPG